MRVGGGGEKPGRAGALQRGVLWRLGLRWGQVLKAGIQSIQSLKKSLANESLDAGGWADLSLSGELGLRRHTLSSSSI